jgi:hypothetical protein
MRATARSAASVAGRAATNKQTGRRMGATDPPSRNRLQRTRPSPHATRIAARKPPRNPAPRPQLLRRTLDRIRTDATCRCAASCAPEDRRLEHRRLPAATSGDAPLRAPSTLPPSPDAVAAACGRKKKRHAARSRSARTDRLEPFVGGVRACGVKYLTAPCGDLWVQSPVIAVLHEERVLWQMRALVGEGGEKSGDAGFVESSCACNITCANSSIL